MQKSSLIHKLILKIQWILWSCELKEHAHPIIIESTYNFPEIIPADRKSLFDLVILNISQFYSLVARLATTIFLISPLKNNLHQLLIYRNLYQHVNKSDYSINLFWGYCWLNLVVEWLKYITGTKFFPNVGFVQEHRK